MVGRIFGLVMIELLGTALIDGLDTDIIGFLDGWTKDGLIEGLAGRMGRDVIGWLNGRTDRDMIGWLGGWFEMDPNPASFFGTRLNS